MKRPTLLTNFRWGLDGKPQEMLVAEGRVVERGEPGKLTPADAEEIDCHGQFLLPAFHDCHCHILPTGLDLQKLNLSSFNAHREVLDGVRDWERQMPEGEWLLAVHYDQTKYKGGKHLTRNDLDKISATRPIILRHSSGHASVANSAALKAAQIDESIEDPGGGTFVRDQSGNLNGVLLEKAHEIVTAAAPHPTFDQMVQAILIAGEKMAELGIACASDMMTGRFGLEKELEAYQAAAQKGCAIRSRLYPVWSSVLGPKGVGAKELELLMSDADSHRCRIAGIKIFADGAIGAGTAAIYGRFEGETEGENSGQLIYPPERLKSMVEAADNAGFRIAIHSIGDRSTDVVMDALQTTQDPKRHRIEHAMILSDSQISRLAKMGVHVSMQPEFLSRFGHAYKRQLGDRAKRLKRFRSVKDAGIPLSLSSDRPIVTGDPWEGIAMASSRPSGFDPNENLTRTEAIEGYTRFAGMANGEDAEHLSVGSPAEFNLLLDDPLKVPTPQLNRDFGPTASLAQTS